MGEFRVSGEDLGDWLRCCLQGVANSDSLGTDGSLCNQTSGDTVLTLGSQTTPSVGNLVPPLIQLPARRPS